MATDSIICNLGHLAEGLGCSEERISKTIFDGTKSGAYIACDPNGVNVGAIVEGAEESAEERRLLYPFLLSEFWAMVREVDEEALEIWDNTHGCPDCWPEFKADWVPGGTAINPDCPECHGHGIVV